jgi:4-hydroxy-tetrahydrodipicolinate reductase
MGQETIRAIMQADDLTLVGQTGHQDDLAKAIQESKPNTVIDFTIPDCVYQNSKTIIEQGVHPIIGTSGLSSQQIEELQMLCQHRQLGGIIAPNFSIGAVLMMKLSQQIAYHLPQAEIIEMHHDKKIDAPSGTAIKTAAMIASARQTTPVLPTQKETIVGARGANCENVPIHSVRLPGLVAHQMVIFGGESETFTLRHDSLHRASFMPGVLLACRKVQGLKELVYGLENILTP